MNLQQTIEELEQQAARYVEVANALRALMEQERAAQGNGQQSKAAQGKAAQNKATQGQVAKSNAKAKAAASRDKSDGRSQKRTMSPETRAKLSAAAKARHAARKSAANTETG